METIEVIKSRRSIRKFKSDMIPRDILENVILAASYAPSWKNTQVTRYTAIENDDMKKEISLNCGPDFNKRIISGVPVVLALSVVKNRSGYERDGSFSTLKGKGWEMFDCGVAAQTLCLAAHDYGLGTVILGFLDYDKVSSILNLPKDEELIALIAIGYPDEVPVMPKRKGLKDIFTIY